MRTPTCDDNSERREKNLRTTAVEELDEAIRLMERLEEENLQLRTEMRLLQKGLEEGGQVYVTVPQRGLSIVKKHQETEEN